MKQIAILLLVLMSGCSLLGEHQWSAYKVTVDVKNETGQVLEGVKLESNNVKEKITDNMGRVELKFRNAGLHVVTLMATDKVTKQIKIFLPQDDGKIVNVVLSAKK